MGEHNQNLGSRLSARELQVAELAARGYSNREIASELTLSEQVVKNVLHSVFDKMGVWNRVELAMRFLICQETIQQSQLLAVKNTAEDARFAYNPLVQAFGEGFYASAPILTDDGYALGVVCIIDRVPRQFSTAQLSILTYLAQIALQQIELRLELLEKDQP